MSMLYSGGDLIDIAVTSAAASRIRFLQARSGLGNVLCISVGKGGCSGRKYELTFSVPPESFGLYPSPEDPLVALEPESATLLRGCTVDFINSLASGRFKISSQSADGACKCGQSFK